MIIILLVSVPLYVCATSSVPIAAVLLLKGLSPGAALVFLMAGPATNAATMTVIGKTMGRKTLYSYLATIIGGALVFGFFIDYFIPRELFMKYIQGYSGHQHQMLPQWLMLTSTIVFTLLLLYSFLHKYFRRKVQIQTDDTKKYIPMKELKLTVKGMTCSHCKMNVENNLKSALGIQDVRANPDTDEVIIGADDVDLEKVKNTVEGIGYSFGGVKK